MSEYSFPFRTEEEERLIKGIDGLKLKTTVAVGRAVEHLSEGVANDHRFDRFTPDELAEVIHNSILELTIEDKIDWKRSTALLIDEYRTRRKDK